MASQSGPADSVVSPVTVVVCRRDTLEPIGTVEVIDGAVRFIEGTPELQACVQQGLSKGVFRNSSSYETIEGVTVAATGIERVGASDPDFMRYLDRSLRNGGFCTAGMAAALRASRHAFPESR